MYIFVSGDLISSKKVARGPLHFLVVGKGDIMTARFSCTGQYTCQEALSPCNSRPGQDSHCLG